MIQFISVTKKYPGNIEALYDVSFEIQEGEFVFLVGPSGSGKTTIIKMLIREELPTEGQIYFDDDEITRYNRKKVYQLRRKIGVIFQDFKLINELTAYENISFAMEAAGKSDKEIKDNVPYLLDIVGLTHRMKSFPYQLSGGEKQRVAIARAMANNPKLLIADEPTGNLDPESSWDIAQILFKINNWGTTVLMSTHGSDIVNSLHKRVIRMQNGGIVRDDYKGSYDDMDEFSLKILSKSAPSKQEEDSPKDPEQKKETKTVSPKPENSKQETVKLKQRGGKNISYKTRKQKPKINLTDITSGNGDKETIEQTNQNEDYKLSLNDLDLNQNLKTKISDSGINNLGEIIEKGLPFFEQDKSYSTRDIENISKLINTYKDKP